MYVCAAHVRVSSLRMHNIHEAFEEKKQGLICDITTIFVQKCK